MKHHKIDQTIQFGENSRIVYLYFKVGYGAEYKLYNNVAESIDPGSKCMILCSLILICTVLTICIQSEFVLSPLKHVRKVTVSGFGKKVELVLVWDSQDTQVCHRPL